MLALAIALLITFAATLAVLTIADSAIKAREAYARLLREAALMQAGFVVQVEPRDLRMRQAPARFTPGCRSAMAGMPGMPAIPACAFA